jgi:purine-nucleoside phosphorylase
LENSIFIVFRGKTAVDIFGSGEIDLTASKNGKETKSVEEISALIRATIKDSNRTMPSSAVVLGSGVSVLNDIEQANIFSFEELFGITPSVSGHAGSLTIGRLPESKETVVALLRGRFHLYEGHAWSVITLATRVLISMGIKELILTNAAGGVNSQFEVGDLMVLKGFRDLLSANYVNDPLKALNQPPQDCQNHLTEKILRTGDYLANQCADLKGADPKRADGKPFFKPLRSGVYAALSGPSYETLAEIEMIRRLGCDAVGMSTVPEILTASGSQTIAAGISVITNVWSADQAMGGHEEVLEASKAASLRLDVLLRSILSQKQNQLAS